MAEPTTIICVCHDVTEKDLLDAFAAGHTHPETLKRATGCFMGPCQGRYCAPGFAEVYERLAGVAPVRPVLRPPLGVVRMGQLAGEAS